MSDSYRKDFKRRGESYGGSSKDYPSRRQVRSEKDRRSTGGEKPQPQPTILIKARETDRAPSPGVASTAVTPKKDAEPTSTYQIQTKPSTETVSAPQEMASSVPLLILGMDTSNLYDMCLEFLSDQSDFLVVGCLGRKGVGKSTILSFLAQPNLQPSLNEKMVFPAQSIEDEKDGGLNFSAIKMHITSNRMILLDCHATLSPDLPTADDTNSEIHSLQLAAFLFSVCHVVLFVQDYFIDPDLIRYLQSAEMLKPSTSTAIGETMVEYFPHLVFIHNRAEDWEFEPTRIKDIQDGYLKLFAHSRLQIQTGFGIANGDVSPVLDTSTCGPLVNVFLLPNFSSDDDVYTGHPLFKDTFRHLRSQILSTPRTSISPSQLTEKNWFLYAGKVWENTQKSSFFKEYHRLISAI